MRVEAQAHGQPPVPLVLFLRIPGYSYTDLLTLAHANINWKTALASNPGALLLYRAAQPEAEPEMRSDPRGAAGISLAAFLVLTASHKGS